MSLRAWDFHLRREAGRRAAEADARRLRQLQREAREPEEPRDFDGWAKEIREAADGTAGRREVARKELRKWNQRRLADDLADKLKETKSMHVAADLLAEVL